MVRPQLLSCNGAMGMLGSLACTSDRTSALSTALRPYTKRQSGWVVIRRQSRAAYFLVKMAEYLSSPITRAQRLSVPINGRTGLRRDRG